MQDPELEELDLPHVLWYFQELERLGWKRNGINLIAIALRKLFEFCNLRGYHTFNEQLIPVPQKEFNIPRVTDIDTFKKLLKEIPSKPNRPHYARNRAMLLLLWDTGARVGEILSLNVDDLDMKKRTALIRTEKSRGRRPVRQIFWTEDTNKHLKAWLTKKSELQKLFNFRDEEALFISIAKSGQYDVRGQRMTNRGAAEVMRMLSNRAKLPVVNAHSIRHSMGRDTVKTLRSNSAVSNVLGHSNLDSSYIYTMLWGDDLKEDWARVMKSRGNPMAHAPKSSRNFPIKKGRQESVTQGRLRQVIVKTTKYGRMARS
jgi:integrase/recombinase XerC